MSEIDRDSVIGVLNRILEAELAGAVRYTTIHSSSLASGEFPSSPGCGGRLVNRCYMPSKQVSGHDPGRLSLLGYWLDSHMHDVGSMPETDTAWVESEGADDH